MTDQSTKCENAGDQTAEAIRRIFGKLQRLVIDLRALTESLARNDSSPLAVSRLAGAIHEHLVLRLPEAELDSLFSGDRNATACVHALVGLLKHVESDARLDAIGGCLDRAHVYGSVIPSYLGAIAGHAHQATKHRLIEEWLPSLIAEAEKGPIEWTVDGEFKQRDVGSDVQPKRRRGRPKRPPEKVAAVLNRLADGKKQDEVAVELGYANRSTISKIKSSSLRDSVK